FNFGERRGQPVRCNAFCIIALNDWGNQTFPSSVGEVIIDQGVTIDIDLRGELAMAVGGHEEVNMRGTVAMTAELIKQFLRRAIRRAAVAVRHDALEAVATLLVGNDGATHVERLLLTGGIEMGIKPLGIGVPD